MRSIVVDSSVIAKWFFPDEQESDLALQIKEDYIKGDLLISAPLLIYYEINNLLKTSVKSMRINRKKAFAAYNGFLNLDFIVYSQKNLLEQALEMAIKLDISSYDASYIVLAEYLQSPFFTADQKLYIRAKSKYVKKLQEYHT
ncbi:hypothetical protein A2164_04040 [Candidatus Curtissbacteria bacterium RBG_13_35_7]|uniref:PIN domain-containing protein n=1 Tax=Candidatus Curtissbacteria bacterium RBG_13_35_7 TaxID=1797705 RepID=A0A1F5G624_9BACT|nr:MAG: hypothetical protein A2164_04040 [Candidatus Curtissbacteria bacterium RBG_13_35_7]